ncbi:sugar ABC transporter substrate-binding protein [Agromyces sp. ISL-38]|uniref:ABC transporter substrate-binding protein n=1 Tax=Agromyces sp. ISL-38 TaxID=2819107 RepID=UPI001BEB6916|nr:sugar ABC transporter substrate-binding protein [Agromyces sp. ISL-38]MBT2499291.1 sugar ABC transporter substrate-binding protein [Agromyces sp. ISL-38]MBT2518172.1 sugar ABC transporter substrate-binding protein [Streptomyces sp. ISL-90]
MKRITIASTAAVGIVALLAGCSAGAPSDGKVTLSYGLWDSNQLPAYEQCAADFEKTQDDIKVKVEQVGWDDYWNKITTGFVSGENFDVFTSHVAFYPEFQASGQVLPLDDYIAADKLDTSIYQDGLLELWQDPDGVQYGLPKDFDTIALFYNSKFTDAAGYTADDLASLTWNPQDGGTYEDVIAHLTVDANGVRGDEPGFDKNNVATYGLWMEASGGADGQTQWSFLTASLGWSQTDKPWADSYNYDAPEFADTISWWHSLVEKGYMPSLEAQTGISWADQLIAGKAALVPNGSWMTGYVFDSASDGFAPAIAATPVGPDGKSWSMFNGLADNIAATTKHPDEAWEWLKYLASTDCQDVVADAAVVFPAIKTSTEKAVAAFEAKGVDVAAFADHVTDGTTVLYPITDHKSDVNATMTPVMEAIMSGKSGTDALIAANDQVNALFK